MYQGFISKVAWILWGVGDFSLVNTKTTTMTTKDTKMREASRKEGSCKSRPSAEHETWGVNLDHRVSFHHHVPNLCQLSWQSTPTKEGGAHGSSFASGLL